MPYNRILVVDDSEADQFIAEMVVADLAPNANITIASDGVEALEVLQNAGSDAFDLILLDVNMPRMDGHAFLDVYSERTRRKPPVVVMLTSSDQKSDRERCGAFDCVEGYVVKPLSEDWVRANIK